ncbi:MAG: class I SAM-dependent methyltransferase [Actinomycetota bacterium]|nr:class I SAM-dependent methyltransferase [Actinomycetota bacterium]
MTRVRETATVHALPEIDDCIDLMSTSLSEDGALVDLGCSTGGLSVYIEDRLRLAEVYGVDRNTSRPAAAAQLGVHTIEADLEEALPLPLDDDCASIVTSFGVQVTPRAGPGILPTYRTAYKLAHLRHVHLATLRCIRELLEQTGFEVVRCYGFSPHTYGFKRVLDGVSRPFPSLSRKFLILARARATT